MDRRILNDHELNSLLELAKAATAQPWHVRHLDDEHAMNLIAISTVPDSGKYERWPGFKSQEIIAATLVQQPRYVDVADKKWEENAAYIVAAANAVPALINEILNLRENLKNSSQK